MWIVMHRSHGPNIIAGPFQNMDEATSFVIALSSVGLEEDAVSFFGSREEAEAERAKELTFVPA